MQRERLPAVVWTPTALFLVFAVVVFVARLDPRLFLLGLAVTLLNQTLYAVVYLGFEGALPEDEAQANRERFRRETVAAKTMALVCTGSLLALGILLVVVAIAKG